MTIALSVLICSTHTRWDTFGQAIQRQIWDQYAALTAEDQDRVEVLMLTDNKRLMLGAKRNVLVDTAQGDYIVFVDDDDRLEPDYLAALLAATASNADVLTFLVSVSLNGEPPKPCRYSIKFRRDRNTSAGYERLPNHICAVRRTLARQVSFPHIAYGEDSGYAKLLLPHLRTEHHIPRVLYHYDYNLETTEAQQHLRNPSRPRPDAKPVVDVIILSKAATPRLRLSTQRTIDTCLTGANGLPLNITVMEQQRRVTYRNATTVQMPPEFHYNRFANDGARRGSAPWIMVANNDLLFNDGWLHHLLAADHPIVSPKCPRDDRQTEFTENTTGFITARHLSGWCFMVAREVWERMGGFDECVSCWCSDDVVIEQARALDIAPMIVPAAVVEHIPSQTLKTVADRGDLTWAQLDIFITKFGSHRLQEHPGYISWRASHAHA